ncbi:MAG: hypothetical protein J6V30_06400 [Paludibacteraceae bacterium]|nr:hypothetical protein [Paludibacteraceae bacterium]
MSVNIVTKQEEKILSSDLPTDTIDNKEAQQAEKKSIVINKEKEKKLFKPVPWKAVVFNAFLPGAGEIYNRKYWKLPIVYAGYGGLIYWLIWNQKRFSNYHSAYVSIADPNSTSKDWVKYIPTGYTEETVNRTQLTQALNTKQMSYRRWRDYSILSLILWYGLTLLDAYVDAQLYDFDISPDLSMSVDPEFNIGNAIIPQEKNIGINFHLKIK